MFANFVLSILELNWNQRGRDKKTNLKICLLVLTSSTQRQNLSFFVIERKRTTTIYKRKMENVRAKLANYCFSFICKFMRFLLRSSPCLLKLPKISVLTYYVLSTKCLPGTKHKQTAKQHRTNCLGLMRHYITPCEDSVKQL